jgi:hypothetical protein
MRKLLDWFCLSASVKASPLAQPMLSMGATSFDLGPDSWMDPAHTEGTESVTTSLPDISELDRAEHQFRHVLSTYLARGEKLGMWILCSATGVVEESPDESALYRGHRDEIGKTHFLGRIHPGPPEADVTHNWFAGAEEARRAESSNRRR